MRLTDYSIDELASMHYDCSCHKTHYIGIEHVAIGKGVITQLTDFLKEQKLHNGKLLSKEDHILIVADINTWKAAGKRVKNLLDEAGYCSSYFVFPYEKMHTEEKFIEELKNAMPEDIRMMIGVGSGTINDITRYVSFQKDMPYYIVGTAPSMDGYASDVSPVIIDNLKRSLPAHCAAAIIGDTDILATAPEKMIAAGVGDIMAKFLDINDWRMSKILNGEDYCEEVAELMLYSTEKCVENIDGLVNREPEALKCLMESLVLIGIAMAYVGSSRPGSAAEHSMAHVMEMTSLLAGDYGELHGTCVGMATCVITKLYEKFLRDPINYEKAKEHADSFDYERWTKEMNRFYTKAAPPVIELYGKQKRNDPENVKRRLESIQAHEKEIVALISETVEKSRRAENCIQALHGWTSPVQFGFSREHMRDIILYSKEQRDRYAAIQFLYETGKLEELTDELLAEYYDADNGSYQKSYGSLPKDRAMDGVKLFVLDMDGTVYLGDQMIEGSMDFIRQVEEDPDRDFIFFTNNASRVPSVYVEKLHKLGLDVEESRIVTAGDVCAEFLKVNYPGARVYLNGTPVLEENWKEKGIQLVEEDPDVAVQSFDTTLTYHKLDRICHYVRNGVPFIATHMDTNCPTEYGFMPDCGAMCSLIADSTGVKPRFLGKPWKETVEMITQITGYKPEEMGFVGDRLYTDVATGVNNGAKGFLVLTGEADMQTVAESDVEPTCIYDSLYEMSKYL